jgi:hypothetical protein
MIKEISREIKVEEIPEKKKFKVTMNILQEADPEDILKNMDGIKGAIKADEDALNIKRDLLESNIQKNKEIVAEFEKNENTARLWKKENELLAQRTGKEVSEIQEHNENFAQE